MTTTLKKLVATLRVHWRRENDTDNVPAEENAAVGGPRHYKIANAETPSSEPVANVLHRDESTLGTATAATQPIDMLEDRYGESQTLAEGRGLVIEVEGTQGDSVEIGGDLVEAVFGLAAGQVMTVEAGGRRAADNWNVSHASDASFDLSTIGLGNVDDIVVRWAVFGPQVVT